MSANSQTIPTRFIGEWDSYNPDASGFEYSLTTITKDSIIIYFSDEDGSSRREDLICYDIETVSDTLYYTFDVFGDFPVNCWYYVEKHIFRKNESNGYSTWDGGETVLITTKRK